MAAAPARAPVGRVAAVAGERLEVDDRLDVRRLRRAVAMDIVVGRGRPWLSWLGGFRV